MFWFPAIAKPRMKDLHFIGLDGAFGAMLNISTGEEFHVGYVSKYMGRKRYNLMSKLAKVLGGSGPGFPIFWVFCEQKKNGTKRILHTDLSYSDRTFRRRVEGLKKAYKIDEWEVVKLKLKGACRNEIH